MVRYDSAVRTISPLDLRRSLGRILDEASAGQRFIIERDRRPLAALVSVEDLSALDEPEAEAHARRLAAIEALEAFRSRIARQAASGPSAADLVRGTRDALDRRDARRASGEPEASVEGP
jgi:antitoxin (DNA-binding transcriptional repressor) of toxin-antitoxin stability system